MLPLRLMAMLESLIRHIMACRNVSLPGRRFPLRLGDVGVGWITGDSVGLVAEAAPKAEISSLGIGLSDAASFEAMADALAARGVVRHRAERFAVRAAPDEPELARVDRGALPFLGIWSEGVHLNGLVRRHDGIFIWIAERAADRVLDPGKLDHLVAGGIPAGLSPAATLAKEATEEAAVPPEFVRSAVPVGHIIYTMERPEGLRRDRLHCYDLWLPEDFSPRAADGEVASFALWPLSRVLEVLCETDRFKFNVALVLIDLFLRLGVIDPTSQDGRALSATLAGVLPA